MITAEDPATLERFYQEVMGFQAAERVVTNLDENHLIASWLTCGNTAHDIAFMAGPQGKLHHFAYSLTDWYAIKHAGGLFAMDDVSVDVGPTQHGITRGETIYFFDPSGNRNEVFSGGYLVFPDSPPLYLDGRPIGQGHLLHPARAQRTVHHGPDLRNGSPRS